MLVFFLTLYKAVTLRRRTSTGVMGAVSLLSIMLRDGTLYFGRVNLLYFYLGTMF